MNYFLRYKKHRDKLLCSSASKLFLLGMKITVVLMLILNVGVYANGLAQRVSINMKDVSLETVFAEVKKQTDYSFLYKQKLINEVPKVSISTSSSELKEVLDQLMEETDLDYRIISGTITITEKPIKVEEKQRTDQIQDDIQISGTVMDQEGHPLPGASIVLKNNPSVGTTVDIDGRFSLTVPRNAVLLVRFIGFDQQEINVGSRTTFNITLQQDHSQLEDVVVTSFGIQRDKKMLGYGVSQVKSDELEKAPTTDLSNSLAGKVAGVQVSGAGGGFSGSNITIRGFSTFTGSNQPLYVVDGIPLDNSGGNNAVNTGVGNSSRISDINPQDIESINVLKGAAATVLYGSRAASGVIIINTKRGRSGTGSQVTFTSNTAVGAISRFPDFQNEYAQGTNGEYRNNVSGSWGPEIKGQTVTNWFGEEETLQAYPNNIRDILQNSISSQNDLSFSGAGEKYDYRVSYGFTTETGLVPGNKLKRNNFSVNAGTQLTDRFRISTSFSYTNNNSDRTQAGNQGANPLWRGIYAPRSYDLTGLPFEDEEGGQLWYAAEDHPYWSIKHIKNNREVNRFYGNVNLKYDFTDWLQADLKIGTDVFSANTKAFDNKGVRSNANTSSAGQGGMYDQNTLVRNLNSYFTVTANRELSDNITLLATVGNEIISNYRNNVQTTGLGIVVPGFDNLKNFLSYNPTASITQQSAVGVFGDVVMDYKDYLSVNVKARNDFTSTLSPGYQSIFYPALAVSFVATNAFPSIQSDALNTLKIRANIGEVGKGASPYAIGTYYGQADAADGFVSTTVNFPFDGLAGYTYNNSTGNPRLTPEFTREIELGADASLFGNRLTVDASVYQRDTRNLIFAVPLPSSSGFTSVVTNAGKLSTKGIELLVVGSPIANENFRWETSVNFTRFKSIVGELAPGVDNISIGGFTSPNVRLVSGEEYGQIWSNAYVRNDNGEMIIGSNGLPKVTTAVQKVGNPNPLFTLGFNNSFSYKNFNFSFLIDWKHKGDQLSRTIGDLRINGVAAETAEFPRFNADGTPNKPYIFEGVLEDGSPNTIGVTAQEYYGLAGKYVAWEGYVLDASFIKLREANISYRLPSSMFDNVKFIKGLQLSVYGRNLFMYSPNYPHLDPEQNLLGISNARGLEFGIQPTARIIGGSLRATF